MSELNLYLSPWIISEKAQLQIDTCIDTVALSVFLKSIPGVKDITDLTILTQIEDTSFFCFQGAEKIYPSSTNHLFVSSMQHQIINKL